LHFVPPKKIKIYLYLQITNQNKKTIKKLNNVYYFNCLIIISLSVIKVKYFVTIYTFL